MQSMNLRFLQMIDDYLYGWYQMLTIPAIFVACFWAFEFVPVITVGVVSMIAGCLFREATDCGIAYKQTKDADYRVFRRKNLRNGWLMIICSIGILYGLTYATLHDAQELCHDTSNDIPLTLTQIVRYFNSGGC